MGRGEERREVEGEEGGRRRKSEATGKRGPRKRRVTTKMMRRTELLFERKASSFYGTEILDAGPVLTKLLEGAERCS